MSNHFASNDLTLKLTDSHIYGSISLKGYHIYLRYILFDAQTSVGKGYPYNEVSQDVQQQQNVIKSDFQF